MAKRVVVGIDGSPESMAAAEWAGWEAALIGARVHLLNVWQAPVSSVMFAPDPEDLRVWEESRLREAADVLASHHPELTVTKEQVAGTPMKVLLEAAAASEMVVLGSYGLGGIAGFLYGPVGLHVLAHSDRPMVLVRAAAQRDDDAGAEVVVGVDLGRPCDDLLAFAFEEAAARGAVLRVVHVWDVRRQYGYSSPTLEPLLTEELHKEQAKELSQFLAPWQAKYDAVAVSADLPMGPAAQELVEAARGAALLVVGRRRRHAPVGVHIGPVTHAVVHHAACPVAVVPHE